MEKPLKVFCCYARKDQSFLLELKNRLIPLQRDGLISVYADIDITPGEDWQQKIKQYLNTAHIILLLVSPDFIASEYCYSNEMTHALERHSKGIAHVIPIILRPVDLQNVPFGEIQSLPTDAKPVTKWADPDDAFLDVAHGIRDEVKKLLMSSSARSSSVQQGLVSPEEPFLDKGKQSVFQSRRARKMYSKTESDKRFLEVDFGVVTALPIERDAVLARLDGYEIIRDEKVDIHTYYLGNIASQSGIYTIAVVLTSDAGTVDATATTIDLIRCWNPRYVVMVGIAGGIPRDDLTLGDVVVANQVIEYEYTKELPEHSEIRLRIHRCDALLLDRVKALSNWSGKINIPRPVGTLRDFPKVFIGPIASGNKVIASDQTRERIRSLHPQTLAIEMESEGVAVAAWQLSRPKGVLVIRGISDLATSSKNDEWHSYAASAVAAFFTDFLRNEPITFTSNIQIKDNLNLTIMGSIKPSDYYLMMVRQDLENWSGLGLHRNTRLKDNYISLFLAPGSQPTTAQNESVIFDQLLTNNSQHHNILIDGLAGSGKTTLLRHWALELTERNINDFLPIFLPLGWISQACSNLISQQAPLIGILARMFFTPTTGQIDSGLLTLLTESLQKGRTLILLDAADEVPETRRPDMRRWLDMLLHSQSQCPIVLTSRPAPYIGGISQFNAYYLRSLPEPQRLQFMEKWFSAINQPGKAIDLQQQLLKTPQLNIPEIAGNPLFLTMICIEFENCADLSLTFGDLLNRFVRILLGEWDLERNVEQLPIPVDLKLRSLEMLSLYIYESENVRFTESELLSVIDNMLRESNTKWQAWDILHDIDQRSGLLTIDRGGYGQFSHALFQEYFVARHYALLARQGKDVKHWLQSNFYNPRYSNIMKIYKDLIQ